MKQEQSDNQCLFCAEKNIEPMISNALYKKYTPEAELEQYEKNRRQFEDTFLRKRSSAYIKFKQIQYNDAQQCMRRLYKIKQYGQKFTMLSQYYKFNQNFPLNFTPTISKILNDYNAKKTQFQFKKIKRIVKQQQGISLSSIKSDSDSISTNNNPDKNKTISNLSNILNQITNFQRQQTENLLEMVSKISKVHDSQEPVLGQQESFLKEDKNIFDYLAIHPKSNKNNKEITHNIFRNTMKKNYNIYQTLKKFQNPQKCQKQSEEEPNLFIHENLKKNKISKSVREICRPSTSLGIYSKNISPQRKKSTIKINLENWHSSNKNDKLKKTNNIYKHKDVIQKSICTQRRCTSVLSLRKQRKLKTAYCSQNNTIIQNNICPKRSLTPQQQNYTKFQAKHTIKDNVNIKIKNNSSKNINQLLKDKINGNTVQKIHKITINNHRIIVDKIISNKIKKYS